VNEGQPISTIARRIRRTPDTIRRKVLIREIFLCKMSRLYGHFPPARSIASEAERHPGARRRLAGGLFRVFRRLRSDGRARPNRQRDWSARTSPSILTSAGRIRRTLMKAFGAGACGSSVPSENSSIVNRHVRRANATAPVAKINTKIGEWPTSCSRDRGPPVCQTQAAERHPFSPAASA
jgi:hypothetical protein